MFTLIHVPAVIGAAVAAFALGMVWYGPLLGRKWMRLAGITREEMKAMKMKPWQAMLGMFIGTLVMAYVLAHSIVFATAYLGEYGASAGAMGGFWMWLGFIAPVTAGVFLWEGKSWKLWALNAGYYLLALLLMGAILGVWK